MADDSGRKRAVELSPKLRDRKPSETAIVDLSRVAEEFEELNSSLTTPWAKAANRKADDRERERVERINLGKGKWPEDFMDVLQSTGASKPIPIKHPTLDRDNYTPSGMSGPVSVSPQRKFAIMGAVKPTSSVESLRQFRRPSHRARHSVDTPVLLPKDSILRHDSSPDPNAPASASGQERVLLRRNGTQTNAQRNGIYIPRKSSSPESSEATSQDGGLLVPFPKAVSGEHSSPISASPDGLYLNGLARKMVSRGPDHPRPRIQSENEGDGSRRRPRPNSYDEFDTKPRRSRYESMVNLGAAPNNRSVSDLMGRDPLDGSAVRQMLVVREEGKAPTNFVSNLLAARSCRLWCLMTSVAQQLGNCIGRGQFGAVYRALNLNTGQMVAVKRIGLDGLKEEEVTQLMREVDLVKSLSHPSIVKYEGMARDENTLSLVLE